MPGVVVARVNMSQQFATELLAALQDAYSKYTTVKGIQDLPETQALASARARGTASRHRDALHRASDGSRARGSPAAAGSAARGSSSAKLWKSFVADAGSLVASQRAPVGLGLVAP